MLSKTVDVSEVQTNLPELLSRAQIGTEIILTQGSTPVARLVPLVSSDTLPQPGLHPGAIWTSDDFDEPLAEDFALLTPT
ncbi:MAG: type II toxin-antitoxin system prevent-host-death family antitoxin [Crinalium sp.]